jgi:hypothetical protein
MEQNESTIFPDNHSIEYLKFVFYQAEKKLEDSNKSYEYTTSKTVTILSVTITIVTALSSYSFINLDIHGVFSPKLAAAIFTNAYVFLILLSLIRNVKSFEYHPLGSSPDKLYVEKPNNATQEHFFSDILDSEIRNYNRRISENYELNKKRVSRLDSAICFLVFMPIFYVVIFVISAYFS